MKGLREAQEDYPENISDFNRALSDLNKESAKLSRQKLEIDDETAELMAFLADPEGLQEAMMEIGKEIDTEDLEATARFLRAFINKVVVSDAEATMFYSFVLPDTVETEDGYKTSAPLECGGQRTLLEYSAPAARGQVKWTAGPHQCLETGSFSSAVLACSSRGNFWRALETLERWPGSLSHCRGRVHAALVEMAAAAGYAISPVTPSAAVRNVSYTAIMYESARSGMVAAGWS